MQPLTTVTHSLSDVDTASPRVWFETDGRALGR
jgi:hypothetical protein